jgi:hypothetical protein
MILKASQRGGPRQLALHLLNDKDNEHVTVQDIRGFVSSDLFGAMSETVAIAKGTRCVQPVFSLSLNPPKDSEASVDDLIDAVVRAEQAIGLVGQPRAIVIHEKNGRRHAHAVWSRIDAGSMTAVNLSHFKNKLKAISKELYLEHGWELPDGHKENGWKNPLNFTLAEWQQAKRVELDPREIKQIFQSAWRASDNLASFKGALEHHGFYLAKGDRRGLVALDLNGEVLSVARWTGLKTKDINARAAGLTLRSVDETLAHLAKIKTAAFAQKRGELSDKHKAGIAPLREQLRMLVKHHRKERSILHDRQAKRAADEAKLRAGKFRRGLGMVMDVLTGRLFTQRKENEREALECFIRDRQQTEDLYIQQQQEKEELQRNLQGISEMQRQEKRGLIRGVIAMRKFGRNQDRTGPTLGLG